MLGLYEEKGDVISTKDISLNFVPKIMLLEERYSYLYNNISEAVFFLDKNYKILEYNDSFINLIGYSKEETNRIFILDLMRESELVKLDKLFKKIIMGRNVVSSLNILDKEGEILRIHISCKMLFNNVIQCIINNTDEINMHKLKRENRKLLSEIASRESKLNDVIKNDKMKTEFFTNISHEIRTPINVMLGIIQLCEHNYTEILSDKNSVKSNKYLKIMKQNCYRLLRLINNLIDITKIDAGYFTLNRRNCNIISVIEDITISVVDYAESKGITLIFDTEVEEKIIACDPDKIERIVMNLLSNAIKFTPMGGRINVDILDGENFITVKVMDTGIGIPEDKQITVFNRFSQVEKLTCGQNEGSGIGLSLIKSLVEMHNGSIDLISKEGVGSEFIIKLPCEVLPQEFFVDIDKCSDQIKIERINIEFSDIYN